MRLWLGALLATVFVLGSAAGADEKPSIQAIALELSKKIPMDQRDLTFVYRDGTTIHAILHMPGKRIVDVDIDGSKLESFVDDKNTVLRDPKGEKPPPGEFIPAWIEGLPRLAKDGQRCGLTFRAPRMPVEGASKVTMKASLAVRVGSDEKSSEHKDVELKAGEKIKLGDFTLNVPKEQFGMGTQFHMSSTQPNLGKAVFLGADGKEVMHFASNGRFGFGDKVEYQTYINFDKKHEKLTIKLTYFNKLESINVPVDMQLGVGF